MTVQRIDFQNLLALWPTIESKRAYVELAEDMGVPPNRARQWIKRSYLPPWYWPDFQRALRRKFSLIVTEKQLVDASCEHGRVAVARASRSAETRKRNQGAQADARLP